MITTTNFINAKNILFGDSLGRTGTITQIQNDILTDFEDSPSYESVTINNSITPQDVQIVTVTNNSTKENFKKILSKPNETFAVGNIVVWGSLTYLIIDIDEDQKIQTKGTIQLCNNTLKFYSPITSTLYSIPCIITNKLTLSEDENKYLTTVDNQFYLIVSSSATTLQIKPDDVFKLGVYNYKISTVCDDISVPGLLVFKVVFSEIEQSLPTYTIEILNGTLLRADVNTPLQLNIRVNVTIDGITTIASPNPLLIFNSSNDNICTVDSDGLCTFYQASEPSWDLDAIIDDEMILDLDKTYELTDDCKFLLNDLFGVDAIPGVIVSVKLASDESVIGYVNIDVYETEQDNYTYSLSSISTPDNEIKLNQSKTYTSWKYNNNVVMVQGFTFSVSGDSSSYLLTVVDGNTCTIKCLKSGYTVVLSATDVSDVTKVTTKSIVLKSLF